MAGAAPSIAPHMAAAVTRTAPATTRRLLGTPAARRKILDEGIAESIRARPASVHDPEATCPPCHPFI
ncbi:hypothetical protein GKQ77_30310 [Streptomyces sp. BG9H]|uniref:Uncharacterized protein n=1 Tax=Streptomyces anatolicus TaxID=2675858 RepID=A0ABS6YWG8_9ACTN|nr:hypothetical protein [Streptomyces anatolicus]MBW5425808.1 hypothetical protein [Streptomyces anatolicus]